MRKWSLVIAMVGLLSACSADPVMVAGTSVPTVAAGSSAMPESSAPVTPGSTAPSTPPPTSPPPTTSPSPVARPTPPPDDLSAKFAKAVQYAAGRPGVTGIVLHDRQTGLDLRSPAADTLIWACSTPKLAMALDLLLREAAGSIRLTDADRATMRRMLRASDDNAADTLWDRFGGEDFASRFPGYGMTKMRFTDAHPHRWGWIQTTASDLDRLMRYVLDTAPAAIRDYLIGEMRAVEPNQQWGVWGAGPNAKPGNKNGWSDDDDDGAWIMNSVGFVGEGERYTLAIMNDTRVIKGGFETGQRTTTKIAAILFG